MIYLKTDEENVWLKNTKKHGGKWRRIGEPITAHTLITWILDAQSRMN
jgi:hypothetical protein